MLGFGVPLGTASAEETFSYGGAFDLAIPADPEATAGWMDTAIIEVPDHLIIQDLDVSVSVTHTNAFDLQLSLTSPAGTTVLLSYFDPQGDFFAGDNYEKTVFDDEAVVSITDGAPPFTGWFQPVASEGLAAFDGEDAFGLWQLDIYDAYYLDTGTLDACFLTITVPEPATALVLLAGLGLARFAARRRVG
jgi:subtilisin-like proprotein convertase family protein